MAAYTKCDHEIEKECEAKLTAVIKKIEEFYKNLQGNNFKQVELKDRLWELSQRYMILKKGSPEINYYPFDITEYVVSEILDEWHSRANKLLKYLSTTRKQLKDVKEAHRTFLKSLQNLDFHTNSPFIVGNEIQKPIHFYIELLEDLILRFDELLFDLLNGAEIINIENSKAIENYGCLLKFDENFGDFFYSSISYFKYKHLRNK